MLKVLQIGLHSGVLRTRGEILRHADHDLQLCSAATLSQVADPGPFHLLVICHSIPGSERRAVCADARRRWPDIKVLQVSDFLADASAHETDADATTTWGNPHDLFLQAAMLLRSCGQRSA